MQKALAGLIVAVALAVSASGATFFGIAAWKIVLALAGAALFVMGGTHTKTTRSAKATKK
jgi:hypothetical protein